VEEACFAGRVVYVGYAKQPVEYATKNFVMKEIDIMGSRNATADDFRGVIAYLEAGRFPVDAVITHVVPFAELVLRSTCGPRTQGPSPRS